MSPQVVHELCNVPCFTLYFLFLEEEISVPSEKQRTCFDDGFNYSNKTLVINMTVLLLVFELAVIAFIIGEDYVEFRKENTMALIALTIMIALVVGKGIFLSLKDTRANTQSLSFKVPFVPWIPIVALFSNISLMLQLSRLTWYRFAVWLLIGKMKDYSSKNFLAYILYFLVVIAILDIDTDVSKTSQNSNRLMKNNKTALA